ncbi:NADH-quinone oxidoreductase subunit N [Runella sp. MFBS21]|uniref:NADH-quinone oxidoreductase subunit N n=1 Tax=Runella sp. MFBS21 TaxID=3034018 RepID=UPI0023F8B67A|nr:NADH-quinone oxidoreductase subunit N [Runella sp. MFBS21]MDF7816287.1 NADH-quinone oxidoreductase subunit N [Runella sp. MFBS21]
MRLKDHLYHVIQSMPEFLPEIWLAGAFLLILLCEIIFKRRVPSIPFLLRVLTFGFGLVALVLVFQQWNATNGYLFHHLLYLDNKAVFFKFVIITALLLVLIHIHISKTYLPAEFYSIVLAITLGLCLMTMSVNGLSVYLSLELVSIGSYLIAAFGSEKKSSEGALKYLLFGAISSALMLYGLSFLYGMTGTLDFTSPHFSRQLFQNPSAVLGIVSFLTLAGVLFKLSLVPFHVWTPDMYEAAPTPIVAFLSTAPKAAALLVLMRLMSALPSDLQKLTALLSLISILVGNLSALWQNNLKRLLAYSGIAQAGFMLVGIVALNQSGFESASFYVAIYVLMNIASFILIDLLASKETDLASLAGKGSQEPLLGVCFTILMIALVGLPPTAGFTAKLLVFSALWESWQATGATLLIVLLIVGLLNAIISLFYYFKIPFYLYFRTATDKTYTPITIYQKAFVFFLTLLIVVLFLKADWLIGWVRAIG